MRARILTSLAVIGAAAIALFPSRTSQADPQFVANFGTAAPEGTPWADQLQDIKKRVESESGGRVKIKLFLGSVMGGEVEMVRDVRRGARLQGGGFSTASIAEGANIPLLQIPELPYLFQTNEEADYVLDNILYQPMSQALDAKGFVLAAWAENGWRSFGTKDSPIHTPADLQKFKMRCQETDVHQKMYTALHTQAVTLPISEVLTALQTGIVDGFDNTPLFTQAAGLYEPIQYYSLTRHIYQPAAVVWSKKFFDTMPPDLQTIVIGDPKAESERGRKGVRDLQKELLANFPDLGVQVVELTDAERQVFADATHVVQTQFAAEVEGARPLLDQVNAALKERRGG
ncbi:MAG: TRAP transporter substrate-binding protein [Oligoflexia bacterium]|nr:TRAP transporter substrate-binding protein [Oligoflexia bacterium]